MAEAAVDYTQFKVGDLVVCNPLAGWPGSALGKRYRIVKKGPKNFTCEPVDAEGNVLPHERGIRGDGESMLPVDHPDAPKPLGGKGDFVGVPYVAPLAEGTIVTLKKAYKEWTTEQPCIVIGETSSGKVKVARLGTGDYTTLTVARIGIEVHDLNWLGRTLGSQGFV